MEQFDVRSWLKRRTFHHEQFDVRALVAAKEHAGLTLSVCVPTRNEAATISTVVDTLRAALVDEVPLIDELVVMDAGSQDGTVELAETAGARVVTETEILPEESPGSGKGEGLWKSLYACTGDLVCWVDADIVNIHPRFVTGVVGPLLTDPSIGYVKAFYERPLRLTGADGQEIRRPGGGGRVTELMARPLLNAFWPELAGLAQPLSGEFAGRRSLLEQVPFAAGYGVEIGLLIDLLGLAGPDAIAQVNLDERIHRNQDLRALSRMGFGILQTALARLAQAGRLAEASWASTYAQFPDAADPVGSLELHELSVTSRPPIATVGGYTRRRAERTAGRRLT